MGEGGQGEIVLYILQDVPYSPLFSRDLNFAKISQHISRVFNFAIAAKNCVCRELNFAKLTIKLLHFFFFTKIVR